MIIVDRLSKSFGDHLVLDNVSLQVEEGDIFGIVGHSGAGKSTLLHCLNGLESYEVGSVKVMGQEVRELNNNGLKDLRRNMGMIFQHFSLMNRKNVWENIAFPLEIWHTPKKQIEERVDELLELVGMPEKKFERTGNLSGGQKQRVGIARALALNPKILLCDEATSALDPATTRSILTLLKKINKELGVTIVIITHQMSVIEEACNRVAILDKSRIAECGEVEEVFRRPKSEIAKQLILGEGAGRSEFTPGGRRVRVVFDGKSAFEPIIADIVLNCKAAVNILFADTRTIDGVIYGQMIVQLPDDADAAQRILNYLSGTGVHYNEEENGDV